MTKEEKEAIAKQKEYDSFRGPIEKPKSGSVREKQNALDNQMVSWFRNDRNNLAYTDDTKATPIEGEWEDFGESFHDPDDNIMNPIQGLGELNEIRAEDQGFWEKVGLGAAKMTTTAASTFLDGTVGFVWGVGSAIANRNASRLYDNDFTNAMQDFNEWCEDKMPHYSSKYEGWGADFWGNFIGKDILQNLGFQIGTGLSMLVPGAGEAALGKAGLSITKTLAKFTTLKTARTMSNAFKDVITSTYAAIGESSIEALQNKRDFVKYQNQLNEDNFNKQNQQLDTEWARFVMQNYNGDERKASMSQEFLDYKNKKDELLRQKQNKDRFIQQEAGKVGDMTFMANMAIVGASNYLTFGKAVAGGMGLFKRSNTVTDIIDKETGEVLKKNVSKSTAKDVIKNGKYAAKDKETGEKILRNAMTKERGRTKSPLLNTIKDAVSEGLEEMNQSVASEWFSGAAEDDMLNYDALTRNGMAYDDVVKSINSSWMNYGNMARAFNKVYTDPSQWRQFFSGMIGVGLSPHFQKGSDGKVHFKLNNIGEQNAEINAYNSANAIIADNINNILNSEESQNYINGLVRHRALDEAKRGAVALDSKMDYQDADFAQFISDISMLSEAGKLDLFRAQLESVKNMSDEELEDYCTKLCNDVDGKKVGEFVDNKGNYIGTSDQARYDIRKKINGRVDQLLKDMETYQKSINEIDGKTGGVLNSKDLAVFAWEKANLTNKFERAKSILGSETSAKNLNLYKDKLGLALKNSTNQLKSLEHNLKVEKERVANANKMAEAVGKEKIDASDLQKELQEDIDNLTKNINIATEISQLIADLETMQVSSSESNPIDDVKKLFSKYEDFSESMPELAKVMELSDDKKVSLEALMYSGQLNKLLGWPTGTEVNNDEIDNDYRDAAKLFNRGVITEESLNDLIKNPERYSTGRAEMEQKILEHDNKDTIKAIEDEIKKAIDNGKMNYGNIQQQLDEIIDNLKSAKNEKNVGRRLFRNAVNMLRDTPFDSLRKIALENVLNSKKYQYLRDFAKFVNYVNVRIATSKASPDAMMIAQKTFTEFIKDKNNVEECLSTKIYPEDIDVSELYKDNYTPETYANAQIVEGEVYQLLNGIFKDFAMDYYSPKLNIDKYDISNIKKSSDSGNRNEKDKQQAEWLKEKRAKVEADLKRYVNEFKGELLSVDDQNKMFQHIDSTIENEFNADNYDNEETKNDVETTKLNMKIFMHKYLAKNIKERITKFYEVKSEAKTEEGKKSNKKKLKEAKEQIDKQLKNTKKENSYANETNVFSASAFDKLSQDDGSMEIRGSKEGYYVSNGNVMRGNLTPCNVTFNGADQAESHYAVITSTPTGKKITIVDKHGEIIGVKDVGDFQKKSKGNLNINGVNRVSSSTNLQTIAQLDFLEKQNYVTNDKEQRMQEAREQASTEVLQSNGTMDENGKVDVSQNLHNSTVTVNAIMDDNITRSKSDIETIVESSRPASEQRLTIEYYAVYDYDNDQILRVQLPTNGKRIKIKEENGNTNEVKFSQSQYKKEGINGILKSIYGDNIEILQSSQEEWTGKKAEPKTEEKVETKPVAEKKVNVVNDSKEKDDFDYTTIFNLNDIDGSKVEVETISKPWKKDPSKKNRSMNIYLKGEKDKGYYQLVKDHEDGFYSVHFKTNNGQHTKTDVKPSTKEERAILYQQLINAIPEGGKVSTWGEISKGGIIALNKVGKDMKNVGTRTISLDDEAHTPVDIQIFEKTPIQEQPAKPVETPKQKAKKEAKQKAKNTASELSKQLAKLEQMEKDLEEAVKNNPDYADTLHSVMTFKNYVQLVRDNYEEMGRPEKVVIDANAIWSINNKLTENLKAIFGNDNVLVLSDEEIVLNKDRIRIDTPVHEYTHLWDQAVQRINPEFWNQGKELMKQSTEWQKVINDPAYANIKDNEDKVASEVHSRLSGYIAAGKSVELYAKDRTKDKRNWFKRLIDWFMKFKDFTLKNIFNMSKADCKQVTLEQFLNAPVADFFMQTDPRKIGKEEIVVQDEEEEKKNQSINTKEEQIGKKSSILNKPFIKEFIFDIMNGIKQDELDKKYGETEIGKIYKNIHYVGDSTINKIIEELLNKLGLKYRISSIGSITIGKYGFSHKGIIQHFKEDTFDKEKEKFEKKRSSVAYMIGGDNIKKEDFLKAFNVNSFDELNDKVNSILDGKYTEEPTPAESVSEEQAPAEQVSDEQTIEEPVSEPEATTDTTDVYPIVDTIEDKTKELDEQIPALPLNVENQEEREVFATIDAINEHNDPPVPLDTYRPAISRLDINDKSSEAKPSYVVLGKGFEHIWNMYNALGAWDYVSQGKLSKDDDVYIGYGKVGQNGKTVYEDIVFFVKNGDEYQMIGTMVNKNAPATANKLRNDIKKRYDAGKQGMEKINVMAQKASGQFKSGEVFEFHLVKNNDKFLTTKPSKILNGHMQFTENQYRSLKDVETSDGSKDFNIGFFTPDGLKDNMTVASQDSAKQFNSVNSQRNGHCVLILRKPDGDFQLVPLGVATLSEINKPGNQVANDFKEVVSDLYKLYTSDKSTVLKNNEIIDSLANGGIIARIGNIVHTNGFSLFANANNTITVAVNSKQYKNKRFDSLEQMQDFFGDIMKDCLICINKNTLNNPDTVSKYVESNVFTTNLKTTEFANAFYTLAPIDSKGNALDYINDIQNETYLEENDIAKVLCKFGEKTFAVIDNFGNIKIGVKQFDEFNVSEANRKYSPEQRMRMISYALLKNGMQSNPNDTLFDDYYIDDDENEVSLLAHKTKYGDTIFYETENFTTISPDRVSYKDGEGNKIKFVKKDEKETESVDDEEDFETLDEDEDIIELDDDEEIIELDDDDEEIEVDDEDDDSEEIDNDESDDEIEVDDEESQQEDNNKKNVDLFMSKDFAKNFWKISEHPCFEDSDDPQRETVLLIEDFVKEPTNRQDLLETIGEEAVNTIDKLLEKYDAELFYDYTDLFMSNGNKDFDKSFERVSEEAIQKILKKHSLTKEDPTELTKKKDDNCSL